MKISRSRYIQSPPCSSVSNPFNDGLSRTYDLHRRTQRGRSGIEGVEHGCRRLLVIPIGTANDDGLISDALAIETEVAGSESAVGIDDFAKAVEHGFIVTSESARAASQIVAEATTVAVKLLKDDDLSLHVADLFDDDSAWG